MKVWIAYREGNALYQDRDILGIFDAPEKAYACQLGACRQAIADGKRVYQNPDTDEEGPQEWECNFLMEGPFEVK